MDYIVTVMQAWSLLFNRKVANGDGKHRIQIVIAEAS
jgi:hypothetical protein